MPGDGAYFFPFSIHSWANISASPVMIARMIK